MKLLGVMGSPRVGGSSDVPVYAALAGANAAPFQSKAVGRRRS
jgi:hypothetical protein